MRYVMRYVMIKESLSGLFVTGILVMALLIFLACPSPLQGAECESAREYFNKAMELNNSSSDLIRKEQLYKKAIEICPFYAEAHNNLGDVYERQGRFEDAIAQYKNTIELQASAPYPYFGLGDIYGKLNRTKESREWYEKGLSLKYTPNGREEKEEYAKEYEITRKRLALVIDIDNGGVIKAQTIKDAFTTNRGVGGITSLSFGEGLIPFDYDKFEIRKDAKPQLNEIGRALSDMVDMADPRKRSVKGARESSKVLVFEIDGHTDIRGTDEYNLTLSERRAKSIIDYLVNNFNIPRDKLISRGYGKSIPRCTTGDSEDCHALNRRVEITKRVR